MTASVRDVRYHPESGHSLRLVECPLWADKGHATHYADELVPVHIVT
jgi:hypothetical protein